MEQKSSDNLIHKRALRVIIFHKWYFVVILILVFFAVRWYINNTSSQSEVYYEYYTVSTGDIDNSIKVLGTTKITNQQTLTFWLEWKVSKVYVKEWDIVKKGQLLAELDKKQIKISLSQQSLSIQNARINYDNLLNQYSESDIVKAQNNVDDTQRKLDIAKKELENLVSERWDVVPLTSTKVQSILISTKNIINDSKNIMDDVDEVFYITRFNLRYSDVQIYVSAKNSSYKYSTESNFYQSRNKLIQLESELSSIEWQSNIEITKIVSMQEKVKDFLNSMLSLTNTALNASKNSVESSTLTLSTIDSWVSTFSSANSKVLSSLSTINSNIKDINNTSNDVQSKKNEIANYEAQLLIYKDTLNDMLDWPDYNDKQLQLNSIKQSQLSLQNISQQLENYEIVAPFDWTIDLVWFKEWDSVDFEDWITISNPNTYEVNVLVDQVDVVKIDKWQLVEVSFDSYPWYFVTWTISVIDPTPVQDAGVVSYYAKIALQKWEKKIYDSMTVSVDIIVEKKDNVLIVPSVYITNISGNKYSVNLVQWDNTINKNIFVWINDWINYEVLTWLNLWDVLSTNGYNLGENSKSSSNESWLSSSRDSTMKSMRSLQWDSWWPWGPQ